MCQPSGSRQPRPVSDPTLAFGGAARHEQKLWQDFEIARPRLLGAPLDAVTSLRALGIEIALSRQGHAGTRIIRIHASPRSTVSAVRVGNGGQFL
jgi:hypothetical protein